MVAAEAVVASKAVLSSSMANVGRRVSKGRSMARVWALIASESNKQGRRGQVYKKRRGIPVKEAEGGIKE